ncbi:hypothetical protein TNCV_3993881 [Trichonephila clavipes]|uniref:Uncharacterized protein n=1 Tax=Trichonephila clavipes TaxID=2585209 RepID=A0A8X6SWK8_TRICX|nr:hypothetical protein TNCV_3993881 [Trichonephila clavipes]
MCCIRDDHESQGRDRSIKVEMCAICGEVSSCGKIRQEIRERKNTTGVKSRRCTTMLYVHEHFCLIRIVPSRCIAVCVIEYNLAV